MVMELAVLRRIESYTGLRVIPAELEIIDHLYRRGPTSVRDLMTAVRASPSGYHLTKRCLLEMGLIFGQQCQVDRRVTLLDLSPDLREQLDQAQQMPEDTNEARRSNEIRTKSPAHAQARLVLSS